MKMVVCVETIADWGETETLELCQCERRTASSHQSRCEDDRSITTTSRPRASGPGSTSGSTRAWNA